MNSDFVKKLGHLEMENILTNVYITSMNYSLMDDTSEIEITCIIRLKNANNLMLLNDIFLNGIGKLSQNKDENFDEIVKRNTDRIWNNGK